MIQTVIICAVLCVIVLNVVLTTARNQKIFYGVSLTCALLAFVIYLALGAPGMPAATPDAPSDARQMMQQEFTFMDALSKNPDDADALVRLAALRVLQGRINDETIRLLDRAERLKPGDRSIKFIRSVISQPIP